MTSDVRLPRGLGDLQYGISQISLAVLDLDETMKAYHRAFGWAPWQVFDHVPPVHHNTELRGEPVHYSLKGAEVYVGKLNFELLQPLDGPNLWSEYIAERGEGIASIATMFLEREHGDRVKAEFDAEFNIPVTMKAEIGDHIEYYYLGTQERFGCLIESGSGHAIDFVKPARVYPAAGDASDSGQAYILSQVTLVVRDLDSALRAYRTAFGWGPWKIYEETLVEGLDAIGKPMDFTIALAQTLVGDTNFEIVQPLTSGGPYGEFLGRGEGLFGLTLKVPRAEDIDKAVEHLESLGVSVLIDGAIRGGARSVLLDSRPTFKCVIGITDSHAWDTSVPYRSWP